MPLYKYKAQDKTGKVIRGSRDAVDEIDLHNTLKEEAIALISVEGVSESRGRTRVFRPRVLTSFCFKISELLSAGVPLIRALTIISEEETIKPAEVEIYNSLIDKVKKGSQLSQAMDSVNGAFPPLLVNMIKSAEETGNLADVFARMSTHYDKEFRFESQIKSSTRYPKILAVLIVIVVCIIVGFVLPQFKGMFAQMTSLPLPTVILLGITDFVAGNWIGIIVAVVVIVVVWKTISRIEVVRIQLDKAKLKLPLIGKQNSTVCTARFCRTFSSLYNSGISAITALQIGSNTIGNAYLESQFDMVVTMIRSGHSLSEAFEKVDGFTSKFVSSVRVGEEAGSLEDMLSSTADTLDFEAEDAMKRLIGYLEPAMIVLMAVIVGFIMIAVIVPIYSSYSTIGASTGKS